MRLALLGSTAVALLGALAFGAHRPAPAPVPAPPPASVREVDIRFFEARVARDPYGARDRAMLAALYLDRARKDGGEPDLERAEALARASLRTRSAHNDGAVAVLASSLMAQHRFIEAHALVAAEVARDSSDLVVRSTLGEIALELGRYAEADGLFGPLGLSRLSAGVGPRYARWLELSGRSGAARDLLDSLRARAAAGFRPAPEQLAWFDLRLGELSAKNGRPDLARAAYARGLRLVPDDARLLTALGRVLLDDGDADSATAVAERALGIRVDPATLILLAESREARGDRTGAEEAARAVEAAVSRAGAGFHRLWGLFLLDHDRRVAMVRDRALADLATRRDIYGLDLAAWALYHDGQPAAAAPLAAEALARGVRDASLYDHAARIALALGDSALARERLQEALAIDAGFAPRGRPSPTALLAALGAP